MSNDDIQKDLAQLRAEVAALSATRQQGSATPTDTGSPSKRSRRKASDQEGSASGTAAKEAPHSGDKEKGQIKELIDLLEEELKDRPAVTCLVIFSLGILMGRCLR